MDDRFIGDSARSTPVPACNNPLRFFDLPLEIRQEVYRFVFAPAGKRVSVCVWDSSRLQNRTRDQFHGQILRVSRKFYSEAESYFWDSLVLCLHFFRDEQDHGSKIRDESDLKSLMNIRPRLGVFQHVALHTDLIANDPRKEDFAGRFARFLVGQLENAGLHTLKSVSVDTNCHFHPRPCYLIDRDFGSVRRDLTMEISRLIGHATVLEYVSHADCCSLAHSFFS